MQLPLKAGRSPLSTETDQAAIELPSADTKRWVIRRKAAVGNAVTRGALTLEGACARNKLTIAEFHARRSLVERHGPSRLRVTRLHGYRRVERR